MRGSGRLGLVRFSSVDVRLVSFVGGSLLWSVFDPCWLIF